MLHLLINILYVSNCSKTILKLVVFFLFFIFSKTILAIVHGYMNSKLLI